MMTVSIRPDGRWGGSVTSRPLPEDDSIGELSPLHRCMLADIWLGRAASERRVADSFVVVRDALVSLGAVDELVGLATRAIDDEMRHAELSRVVASRYAREPLAHPPRLAPAIPLHAGASERLCHVLHVTGQCAFNETIASTFLEAALVEATAPLARAALRELLSDEIDHARGPGSMPERPQAERSAKRPIGAAGRAEHGRARVDAMPVGEREPEPG